MANKSEIQKDEKGYYIPARAEIRLKKCTRCKGFKALTEYRSANMCITCCEKMLKWKRERKRREIDLPALALATAIKDADALYDDKKDP